MVGQAPSRSQDFTNPVETRLSTKLAGLMGVHVSEFLTEVARYNVLPEWPGPQGKGDKFPMYWARREASDLMMLMAGRRVILLGTRVSVAFGLRSWGLMRWHRCERDHADYAVLPHPSGVNHWWNSPDNREAAAKFMRLAWTER